MTEAEPVVHRKRRPALLAGVASVAGCTAAPLLSGAGALGPLLLGLLLLVAALFVRTRPLAMLLLALAGVALGFTGYGALRAVPPADSLADRFPQGHELVRLEGVLVEGGDFIRRDPAAFEYPEAPQTEDDFPIGADPRTSVPWLLQVEGLPDVGIETSGFVKLYVAPGVKLELLSRVRVIGKLRLPRRAGNPGEIDSLARFARRGITHTMNIDGPGQLSVLEPAHALDPRRFGPWVHERFHTLIGSRMARDQAALIGAAALGERGNLSAAQRSNFVRSGTIHLLVVSGLHVALLAGAIVLVCRALGWGPRVGWALAALAAFAYLMVTGIQPSVLRAFLMIAIYALGRVIGRKPDSLNVLGASALLSLAINPADVFELGFQLSYLAVLGLLLASPMLRLRTPANSPQLQNRGLLPWSGASLRASLGVAVLTWPLLAATVHVLSPSMVATNLVAGPLLTLILVLMLFAPLAVIPAVGSVLAWALSLLATVLSAIADFFAHVPGGHFFLPAPPLWWLVGCYAALLAGYLATRFRLPPVLGFALPLLWLAVLPVLSLARAEPPGPARITVLDVGQGQCVVIEVPNGPCVVLDCGSTSLGGVGERVLAPFLWERGRTRIDTLILSHADADHVNGLPQLFDRFPVGSVLVSEVFTEDEAGAALHRWLSDRTDVHILRRGDSLQLATGLHLDCLWPDPGLLSAVANDGLRRNEGGLVLLLRAGPTQVLMPSDGENAAYAGYAPLLKGPTRVLLAPHQGSKVEGIQAMLARLQPEFVIISARETFPSAESMQAYGRVATVLPTWETGALTVLLGADGSLTVERFLAPAEASP